MAELPFQTSQAFESMRDSDFDSISAFGEVIDNSIQANARVVNIRFNTADQGKKKIIDSVVFSDDGCGMDTEVLQKCLKLGWSARYNNRDGIGRFGVGMTLGAIHECRRVEVYSKQTDGDWHYTYLDLDEISDADRNDEVWKIPNPRKKNPSENEKIPPSYIPDDCGTIVLWSKYDRLKDTYDTLMREFVDYIGRTYRYFIWNKALPGKDKPVREYPVSIKLNGKEVFAHDPLYVTTEKTK